VTDLFAGICVRDFERARAWYERLFGVGPSFEPHATEAVWEIAEHRYLYIVEDAPRAGHAVHTVFVDDLDARVQALAARGLEPQRLESFGDDVRKITYRDPDGNEVSFGGGPARDAR
jgi:hypothetical protein